ncbi:MAG: phage minor head protein [Gemmatimonas sp.]
MPNANMPPGMPFGPDWQLRALIARQRYGNQVVDDVDNLLRGFYQELEERIAKGTDLTNWQRDQLGRLMNWSAKRLREVVPQAHKRTVVSLVKQGTIEGEALYGQASKLRVAMGLPSRAQLIQTARFTEIVKNIDVGGHTFADWWERDASAALARIKTTVQRELLKGRGPRDIARYVFSKDPSVGTMHKAGLTHLRMLVRTSMTAVSTQAAKLEYSEMRAVIDKVRVEAVLDARTSEICMAVDNQEFPVDSPLCPQPPLHPNCRTALVAVADLSVFGLTREKLGHRVTYDEWFRAQDAKTQDSILGSNRAAMVRKGTFTLRDVINADGKRANAEQFRRAMTQEGDATAEPAAA